MGFAPGSAAGRRIAIRLDALFARLLLVYVRGWGFCADTESFTGSLLLWGGPTFSCRFPCFPCMCGAETIGAVALASWVVVGACPIFAHTRGAVIGRWPW